MARFYYFIPGAQRDLWPQAELDAAGVAYAIPRDRRGQAQYQSWQVAGPEGRSGTLLAPGGAPLAGLDPARLEWQRVVPVDGRAPYYLGLDRANLPGPADLEREFFAEGHPVTLGDGRAWLVPVVHRFPQGTALPEVIALDEFGLAHTEPKAEFAELYALALRLRQALLGEPDARCTPEEAMRLAELALGVNYRVTRWEIAALKLLDTRLVREIGDAVLDGPSLKIFLEELGAKKAGGSAPGAASNVGAGAGPGTSPVTPRS